MTTDRVFLEELRKDEALQAFRALVGGVLSQGPDIHSRAVLVRPQARAKAQDCLNWLRQREEGKEVCR